MNRGVARPAVACLLAVVALPVWMVGCGADADERSQGIPTEVPASKVARTDEQLEPGAELGRGLRKLAEGGASTGAQRDYLAEGLRARKVAASLAESIVDRAVDGVTLRPTKERRRSRLGGLPIAAVGDLWPTNDRSGKPLALLAVLDLAELEAQAPLPSNGTLVLFYDAAWMESVDPQVDDAVMDPTATAEVRWIPPGTKTVELSAPAAAPDGLLYPRLALDGTSMAIVGELERLSEITGGQEKAADLAWDTMLGVAGEAYTFDQLLGASQDIQGPVLDEISYWFEEEDIVTAAGRKRYSASERQGRGWTLVAQIGGAGTDEMMFSDAGCVSFAVPTADLVKGRFDRAVGILQSS